ncbi:ATP-grasp domain-containing protein [Streptomyces sp. NBC_01433]|uniref:ATP-grasp domain-containing protein n=1 Tax=Streptomyces sp. NBC_01433 TaxID=2903864 RepID=UPI002254C79C|nr:ATP-grasp domain-containing protein [Streptomyces sp. NBC_01433]MCX4680158.1 ATP-grasp domain-containing protein [Streptomyces sp. NBC_01433]
MGAEPVANAPLLTESTTLEGIDASNGLRLLGELVDDVVWLDRTDSMISAFGHRTPWLRHAMVSALYPTAGDAPIAESRRGARSRSMAVAFAPEEGDHAITWAAAHGRRLLAAPKPVTARAADKIDALEVFSTAGVPVPEYVLIPAHGRRPARAYWPGHWTEAVLQRRENNLIGRGTLRVCTHHELERQLRAWDGHALKLSRLVPGLSLTVSACVGGDRTVVSALSHQLVGLPELTPGWGMHCGNQLIGPADLPAGLYDTARDAARAVGETLRERGYRGVFGLDLLHNDRTVLAVEINPRFQAVTSLVQAAEQATALLPSLGLHILACLLPSLPPPRTATTPVPALSQIVLHADRPAFIEAVPPQGLYRKAEGHLHGPFPISAPLTELKPDEALWWPQIRPGPTRSGDELLTLQTNGRLSPLTSRTPLGPTGRTWTQHLQHALRNRP